MGHLVPDALTVMRRNLSKLKRVPGLLVFSTMQPISSLLVPSRR